MNPERKVSAWPTGFAIGALVVWSGFASAQEWQAPRTSTGVPDLQGIWTNATITTLERPRDLKGRSLTPEQGRDVERSRAQMYDAIDQPQSNADGSLPAGADVGGYNTFWMDEGNKLAVVNGEIRTSLIVEPEDGRIPYRLLARPAMMKDLMRMRGMDGPEQRPLGERCIVGFGSTGGPPMLPVLYNNLYQIVQTPDHVMILVEMNHDARVIRIGGKHNPAHMRKWLGDSVGHWEGDTLVVETTNFHPDENIRAGLKHLVYSSTGLKVTERFTRTSAEEILYTFTMEDPETYSQPWKGELPLRAEAGPIYEYACHEGNYALTGILAGARAEEKR